MDGYEVTKRLCDELGIDYLHINFGGKDVSFTEEEYQETKEYFAKLFLDLQKKKEEK